MSDQSEIQKFETAVRPLRLSEAIRIGSKIRPQCSSYLFENGGSCVWGAAYEGSGGKYKELAKFEDMHDVFGEGTYLDLNDLYIRAYGKPSWMDNDDGMPREQIADRFEALGY